MFFTVAQSCNGCAICQAICPAKNITISQGKPEFHQKCEHCLACLHSCPHQALDWKNKTQGKERYKNPFIKQKELIALSSGETGSSEG
jgi:MinD superfamily P-loop ATPase